MLTPQRRYGNYIIKFFCRKNPIYTERAQIWQILIALPKPSISINACHRILFVLWRKFPLHLLNIWFASSACVLQIFLLDLFPVLSSTSLQLTAIPFLTYHRFQVSLKSEAYEWARQIHCTSVLKKIFPNFSSLIFWHIQENVLFVQRYNFAPSLNHFCIRNAPKPLFYCCWRICICQQYKTVQCYYGNPRVGYFRIVVELQNIS